MLYGHMENFTVVLVILAVCTIIFVLFDLPTADVSKSVLRSNVRSILEFI